MAEESKRLPPHRRNLVWITFQWILQGFFGLWLQYQSRHKERLPARGGGVLISNHQSFLDPLLIGLPLKRPISFMARDSLFRIPLLGALMRHTYVIPISRRSASSTSFRAAIENIENGNMVCIFPEGTRTDDGAVQRFKPGFLALLKRTDTGIYPIGIAGAFRALPRGAYFLHPRAVRVVYGEPIPAETVKEYCERGAEKELLALTHERVIACQRQAENWLDPESQK
ncbi:lysophospholipid acyltransferase family protein [Gimesia panareensis]|uniref:lysophospholipid acyltransferase family protein n=1 Tax=Gimesia panareensis TaxID=2527978 RepID=UPI00118AA297|nr:lysophospholipid acyltransferase family protein [Gimesia panareensis]QDU50476.1 1-acyl-sn-glycerol-3-phosphate acyltransferase [Gimesia panareensis]